LIEARELVFYYPGNKSNPALRGISFRLKKGERVALMGSNGSGKTTLARCLNGLIRPSHGDVVVDGLSILDQKSIYRIRQKVGMVFQNPDNQIVTTTVLREIAFGLENLGVEHNEMMERVEAALSRFHLEPYRDTPPHLLSGGELQRLALASVWVMEPDYLILDEPTSLLDPSGRKEIARFIDDETEKRNIGTLLITQYPEEALSFDRLIVIERGEIVMSGRPYEVFSNGDLMRGVGLRVPVEIELRGYLKRG